MNIVFIICFWNFVKIDNAKTIIMKWFTFFYKIINLKNFRKDNERMSELI